MIPVTKDQAERDRMAHAFRPGMGYVQVGKPLMPNKPLMVANECEPAAGAKEATVHFLNPPMGAQPMPMLWHPGTKEWSPPVTGAGKRIGFTSAYLAAHGWAYLGPAP